MNNKNNSNDHTNGNARGFIWNPPGSDESGGIFDEGGTKNYLKSEQMSSATAISIGIPVSGCSDGQCFKFTVTEAGAHTIYTIENLDVTLCLYSSAGDLLASVNDDDKDNDPNYLIALSLAVGATYYIKVNLRNGATGDYTLKVVTGTSEHSSTSPHIYHAILSEDNNEYTFTCEYAQCNESFTVPKDQVVGSYVTSSTDPRLGNSQTPLAYGIDISSHQKEITQSQWNEIANTQIDGHPIAFVILRIGREVSNNPDGSINRKKDEQFENNYVRAKAAGLQVGCYYYTESWSPENALADAEQVIEWIGDKQFEYPVFFDIESELIRDKVSNNTIRTEICTSFMNKMREAGFFTGLYTYAEWITDYLNSSTLFPKYDVWYARYREGHSSPDFWGWNQETAEYKWPQSGRKFGMWQYTDKEYIPPITVKEVDRNVAYKNYPLIIKALHLNNFN